MCNSQEQSENMEIMWIKVFILLSRNLSKLFPSPVGWFTLSVSAFLATLSFPWVSVTSWTCPWTVLSPPATMSLDFFLQSWSPDFHLHTCPSFSTEPTLTPTATSPVSDDLIRPWYKCISPFSPTLCQCVIVTISYSNSNPCVFCGLACHHLLPVLPVCSVGLFSTPACVVGLFYRAPCHCLDLPANLRLLSHFTTCSPRLALFAWTFSKSACPFYKSDFVLLAIFVQQVTSIKVA